MNLALAALNQYIAGLAKALYTRGSDLPANPYPEARSSGAVQFAITGRVPSARRETQIILQEIWAGSGDRYTRGAYAYDLIDRPANRRRGFHRHDGFTQARAGVIVHEHCEEVLGQPACGHYIGRELPDGYVAIELLIAAWVEPGSLGCDELRCLD